MQATCSAHLLCALCTTADVGVVFFQYQRLKLLSETGSAVLTASQAVGRARRHSSGYHPTADLLCYAGTRLQVALSQCSC